MTVDTSWDINKYKYEHELEHHWELKKAFMEAHKDKFPEKRLVCLAQTFYNVQVLGCRYDARVMIKIKALAEAVAPITNQMTKEKEKYSKGFVPASNAVVERVKSKLGIVAENSARNDAKKPDEWAAAASARKRQWQDPSDRRYGSKHPRIEAPPEPFEEPKKRACPPWLNRINVAEVVRSGPFGRVVIFEGGQGTDNPATIIERTASASQMTTSFNFVQTKNEVCCQFSLNSLFLASGNGPTQKAAKEAACIQAIERLKQTCFTVQVKVAYVGDGEVGRDLDVAVSTTPGAQTQQTMETPLPDDNLGSKMLKLMGWAGGGLGKQGQGQEEPVSVDCTRVNRAGLGAAGSMQDFRKKARQLLEDFATSDSNKDLVFSTDLSKEERKTIHEMVRRYNLKSRSFGKGEEARHLVIFKRVSPMEIVEELIQQGGHTDKYSLIPPSSFIQ